MRYALLTLLTIFYFAINVNLATSNDQYYEINIQCEIDIKEVFDKLSKVLKENNFDHIYPDLDGGYLSARTFPESEKLEGVKFEFFTQYFWHIEYKNKKIKATAKIITSGGNKSSEVYLNDRTPGSQAWYWSIRNELEKICNNQIYFSEAPKLFNRDRYGFSLGLSAEKFLLMDFNYAHKSGIGGKFNIGYQLENGSAGEDYSSTLDWSEFPDDFVEEGSYYITLDFAVGYYFNFIYAVGMVGLASESVYQNNRDKSKILGNSEGKYYVTKSGDIGLNYGFEVGAIIHTFTVTIHYTFYGGFGGKLGFLF